MTEEGEARAKQERDAMLDALHNWAGGTDPSPAQRIFLLARRAKETDPE
jgi:hypothetical protein